jgi:DNA-binding CsgD family transcriptional regulator
MLGLVALALGQPQRGQALALESFQKSLEFHNTRGASVSLDALACIAVSQGEVRQAARLFGAAEGLRLPIGDFAQATIRADRDKGIATVRNHLGNRAFEAQYAAGRAMSVDAIVDYLHRFEIPAGPRRAMLPDRLTARELEILLLLAQRYSNAEIAEKLVLSVRTVERHVTNIYNKTGITARREAVDYCRRHDLLSLD